MKRRQVLKGIGASTVAGVAVGTAAGRRPANDASVTDEDLDELRVVRDGEVVETFEDPSVDDIGTIRSGLAEDERLVTPEDCCVVECRSECCPVPPYDCCMWGSRC